MRLLVSWLKFILFKEEENVVFFFLKKGQSERKEMLIIIFQPIFFTYLNYFFIYFNNIGSFYISKFGHYLRPLEGLFIKRGITNSRVNNALVTEGVNKTSKGN